MNKQSPIGTSGTCVLLRAPLALRFRRAIEIPLTAAPGTSIMQWFSFRTVVRIFLGLVTELLSGEVSLGLVAAIDDRDMRLNVALQQPRQKLSASVSLVCGQTLGVNSKLANMLKHTPRSQRFLTETCRRRMDRQNHPARRVHQIVVVVTQHRRPTFDSPGSIRIGGRHLFLQLGAPF